MKILKANKTDLKFLFQIYNYYIKKNLFSSRKKIKYSDHKKWFENYYLKEKKVHIFILKMNKIKTGYIRYENIKKNIFEVSLALKQDYTGLGLGTKMLKKSLKKFLGKKKFTIISKVKKSNKKSTSCFTKNNFKKINFKNKFFHKLKNVDNYHFFKYVDK